MVVSTFKGTVVDAGGVAVGCELTHGGATTCRAPNVAVVVRRVGYLCVGCAAGRGCSCGSGCCCVCVGCEGLGS